MSNEKKEQRRLMDRLRHTYRLVVMNNETFEEVGSYRSSLMSLYTLIAFLVVGIAFLVVSAIAFTPLRTWIPGYGDIRQHKEIYQLYRQLDDMEKELKSYEQYSNNIKQVFTGDVQSEEDIAGDISISDQDSIKEVERIEEDAQLRAEIKQEERIYASGGSDTAGGNMPSRSLEQIHFIPPVNGSVSAEYEPAKKHYGVDIMAAKNTPIKAVMDGTVVIANWTDETGNTIAIQHPNNLISFYKHNSALLKKVGVSVKAGEAIAIIGNTGTLSSGPHLHFELWYQGKTVDPSNYISF